MLNQNTIRICLFFLFCVSCQQKKENNAPSKEEKMKATMLVFIDSCWNNKDMDKLPDVSSENFIRSMNGIQVANNQKEIRAHMNVFFMGFPDMKLTNNEMFVKGDIIFAKWTFTGTNTGIFGENAPTGKRVKVSGTSKVLFDGSGKMLLEDVYYNELDLLQQLGFTMNPPVLE